MQVGKRWVIKKQLKKSFNFVSYPELTNVDDTWHKFMGEIVVSMVITPLYTF